VSMCAGKVKMGGRKRSEVRVYRLLPPELHLFDLFVQGDGGEKALGLRFFIVHGLGGPRVQHLESAAHTISASGICHTYNV
jgi:hypothetical protein